MEYQCVESARDGGWVVEAVDRQNDGAVSRVLFTGLNDEQLAKEYVRWKTVSDQPQRQPERHTSEV